jgi:quinol monooxygenase YgiN
VIVVTEHRAGDEFAPLARSLLEALAAAEGFMSGQLARSPDAPDVWLIVTRWRDVGSMRRGFGTFEAKVAAAAVMHCAADRLSAFEVLLDVEPGAVQERRSDRA